jgi:hypothetical protein
LADNLAANWLDAQAPSSQSSIGLDAGAETSSAETADAPAGVGHDGSVSESPPSGPGPGPAPGGASGASAAGAAGVAPLSFLTFARLLNFGPPRAMRRLRLSSQPRLTACFVLIPERPD